jgi:CubicO group peptidase (beta-lactamase class C family)
LGTTWAEIDLAAKVWTVAAERKYLPEFADLKVGVETTDPATGKPTLTLEPQKRPMIVQDLLRHTAGLVYGQSASPVRVDRCG